MTANGGPGSAPVKAGLDENIRLYNGEPCTRHVTTNLVIEVAADLKLASARSYITIFQSFPDFPYQPVFGGRYRDSFHQVQRSWYFLERAVVPDLYGDMSRHVEVARTPGPARFGGE